MSHKTDLEKIVKKHGFESIDDLKRQNIATINKFMEETGLSYFEVFFETEIGDLRESIEKDLIKLVRIKSGSKRPQDTDYYNKHLTWKEILSHNGNFGVCIGYNHSKGKSLACIDIDGLKLGKLSKTQKSLLSDDQVQLLENLSEARKKEINQESKDYLKDCILSLFPYAMVCQTQSGGYHIYIETENHLNQKFADSFHYVSQRLSFPEDCPIVEIRGLSLLNSLEIFTKFKSKQCVLAGSFIKNNKNKETYSYKLMDTPKNIRTFAEIGTVVDVNKAVKNGLISHGFKWADNPVQKKESKSKKVKEQILNPYGILKPLTDDEIEEIAELLKFAFENNNLDGVGHYTVLAFAGYFCHTTTEESAIQVIAKVLKNANYSQEDIKAGIRAVKETYKRKVRKTGLNTAFKNIQNQLGLTNDDIQTLKAQLQNICYPTKDKINKTEKDLEILIRQILGKNQDPPVKLLADYINKHGSFVLEFDTKKRYEKTENGFEEITVKDISSFFNDKFGENKISIRKCEQVMLYFTNLIKTNYNLIVFKNGTLDTGQGIFYENYFPSDCLPKLKTHLNYIENAKPLYIKTDLYNEFKEILESKRWGWNEDLYYKCVGVSAMAINESDCFFIINGEPDARKTTLLTPLKRFYKFSMVKLQIIAKNERFQLIPCLRKDIVIDDDVSDTIIKDSGFLKTFISGAGGTIEIKGENDFPELTAETTPIIWGAGNKLPTIHGEGIERRTCLILAENLIFSNEARKTYQSDILNGEMDGEIELMISYSIQQYMKERDKPFLTKEQQLEMLKEWAWKSYPAKMGASIVFMEPEQYIEYLKKLENDKKVEGINYDERKHLIKCNPLCQEGRFYVEKETKTWTPVYQVNKEFKKFHKLSLKNGKIFRESSKPSTKLISQAMSNAGFFQSKKNVLNDSGEKEQIRVYEDCIINPEWEKYFEEKN